MLLSYIISIYTLVNILIDLYLEYMESSSLSVGLTKC